VVDDQEDFRDGLAFLINASPDLMCVGKYANGDAALEKLVASKPDVVLLDIDLGGEKTGLDCIQPLRRALPAVHVVMLTVIDQPLPIFRALCLGAAGYLSKSTPLDQLPRAIRDVVQGGSPMSPEITKFVIEAFQAPKPSTETQERLSSREEQVLQHLAQGCDVKEVAQALGISPETVKTLKKSVFAKLEVNTTGQALARAFPSRKLHIFVKEVARDGTMATAVKSNSKKKV